MPAERTRSPDRVPSLVALLLSPATRGEGTGVCPAGDVQFDGTVGGLVTLDGLPQGDPEPLGGVEIDDETLRNLDVLAAGHERVGVQREVDDDFLRRRRYPREVCVGGGRG